MTTITNLALAGGGIYGICLVGAIKQMEADYSKYIQIKNICGVSVGSLIAALYAVGYTADELIDILMEINFETLIKDRYFTYYRLYEKFGMYDANKFEAEVELLIQKKTNIKMCTFCQIDKNLMIVATNLNYQCPRIFSRDTTPDVPISKVVRMSISYPLIISPVLFEGDLYGDGGESINYPISVFKNLDKTIGITFASCNENDDGTLKNKVAITNIYDYFRSVAYTLARSAYVSQLTTEYMNRTVVIHIEKNVDTMELNLPMDTKKTLLENGKNAIKDQIKQILGI